ncbi:MAG TPA: DUF2288 domain-containing protein [Geobacteraceae bacterium]
MIDVKTKDELALSVDEAEWQWLKPHTERGGLITVAPDLELAEAGIRIVEDDAALVRDWIISGRLGRPSPEQLAAWDATPTRRFQMLIVSPYILIKELTGTLYSA